MSSVKKFSYVTLILCAVIALFTLSLSGCGGGNDEHAFDAYDVDPSSGDSLPRWLQFSEDGRRLVAGLGTQDELYRYSTEDNSDVKRIDLQFTQEDWWTQMENNYDSKTEIPATMSYDGETLESPVGVRFKGVTSYRRNPTEKKSFNISLDYENPAQDLHGYDTLNLNCAWEDDTFMREVIYENVNRRYIPAVSGNYVELYINGNYWGIYINSQQLDNNFIKEWFSSTIGSRWRAGMMGGGPGPGPGPGPINPDDDDDPDPGPPEPPGDLPIPGDDEIPDEIPPPEDGHGPPFGRGDSALKYLGDNPEDYIEHYDLKKYYTSDPWNDLINVCFVLENTSPDEMETEISKYMDLDRTLWFLVMENVFADEDGYIHKGAMDYYLYWDATTGLMTPLEYDGNSVLLTPKEKGGAPDGQLADNGQIPDGTQLPVDPMDAGGPPGRNLLEWTPFQNADNPNYPLLYKLLNVPGIRQRYLAHMRTVLNESFNEENMNRIIEANASKIEPYINNDPKTFITDFPTAVSDLKDAVATRCSNLWANEELNVVGLVISDVKWVVGTEEYASPSSTDDVREVIITATVQDLENGGGIDSVYTYVGKGIDGAFTRVEMTPEGDGIYTATLAEENAGVRTKFYIEAVAGDEAGTRAYFPSGAAHDVFTFQVDE